MFLGVIIWISLFTTITAQYRPNYPHPYLQREIFVLNLEDGFFGCQVNESVDVLQLFELSKLCDGVPQCFLGSDEVTHELKCTDRNFCHPKMPRCINGVCLDNLCYCNDGFGGKGCEMPDENECKYRPCDVFSHCTNTMGSFYCSCFPGYEGDGFECHDINECEIPSLAAICVDNSECCNLPGHYVCKCKPGYTGNATVSCTDINECLDPSSCGQGAECENVPGSYRCFCPRGYDGDPFRECFDLDECRRNPCGSGAQCTNTRGGYTCSCSRGYTGNPTPEAGCVDVDECRGPKPPCGKGAQCVNTVGGYYCQCPEGYTGNPATGCVDINECPHACGANTECTNTPGSYSCRCKFGHIGDAYFSAGCHDEDECLRSSACGRNAQCFNTIGSYTCSCLEGYTGNPLQICTDIDECLQHPCPDNAVCRNIPGSFECKCVEGYDGNARESCTRVKVEVRCQGNYECTDNAHCVRNRCQCKSGFQVSGINCVDSDECRTPNICGRSAVCRNTIGSYQCDCKQGYEKISLSADSGCRDINECLFGRFPCGTNAKCINKDGNYECVCPENLIGDPKLACKSPCSDVDCGAHATCQVNGREAACICNLGYTFDPINIAAGCQDINECDVAHGPSGLCGQGAICGNVPGSYHCYCPPGFTGDPFRYCEDINECDRRFGMSGQCGEGATCTNTLGSFTCSCPPGFTGNGRVKCQDINECSQAFGPNGKCGISAICTNRPGSFDCRCPPGTSGDPSVRCTAVVQCTDDRSCRGNAVCSRQQCLCPEPNFGDDCRHPCDDIFCGDHATCQFNLNRETVCVCSPGYTGRSNSLPGCIDIDECSSGARVCGQDAVCRNIPGSYECVCPHGYGGDPYRGCLKIDPKVLACSETKRCPPKEECVTTGSAPQCVCKRGYTRDPHSEKCRDINECTEVRDKSPCGQHAFCLNMEGSYICRCPPGHIGNPYSVCYPEMIKCTRDNQCPGNTLCMDDGTHGHHCGCKAPFVQEGEYCILVSRNCSTSSPCPENQECVYTGVGYGFCICPRGYTMDATGFCRDIDECMEIKDWSLCGSYADCVNLPGAYQCLCAPGYTGNPRTGCSRIVIECHGQNGCPANTQCVKGQCQCLPPYVSEGQACKHPCDWYSCGQYATCELTKSGPQCVCIPGCTGDPNSACHDINECTSDLPLDPNGPCAVGATCINIVGGYQCECPPGTTGDAYKTGCHGAAICSSDRQCPRNAACDPRGGACVDPCSTSWCGPNADCFAEDHKAECRCRPGFSGNPNDLEKGCVSPCSGVWCGINAHCIVNSHNQGVCHCRQGFVGNPWAGGGCHPEHGCSTSRPCGSSQLCVNNACVERCDGVSCGVGARCDSNTGNCICLPFFIGNPTVLCVPPILPPLCVPGCGVNAHCTYSIPNRCQCNPGFTGNPYQVCGTTQRCDDTRCGSNAQCVEGPQRVDCVCPAGLQGNPFLGCNDVNECLGSNPCGNSANCINSVGSFLCSCPSGMTGNPLFSCTPAGPGEGSSTCEPGQACACSSDASCASGEICGSGGFCTDPCEGIVCGPNANCIQGACFCPQGMVGDPSHVGIGCSPTEEPAVSPNECESDHNCQNNAVCQIASDGVQKCYDVCQSSSVVCGRNAVCKGHNHQALCECPPDMVGDPNDLIQGCQVHVPHECEVSANCPDSHICKSDPNGVRFCENVCTQHTCGSNAVCQGKGHRPVCECPQGFSGDPGELCEPHPTDRCLHDDECRGDEVCKLLSTGIRDCVVVCEGVKCGPNAMCEGKRHVAVCDCRQGFTGDAYDIQRGCQPPPLDLCKDSKECLDSHVCRTGDKGYKECFDVCESTHCGLNALCRGKNHKPVCECRPGFSGDPTDFSIGCQPIPKDKCKSNSNCPSEMVCRQTPAGIKDCIDACQTKRCGEHAICAAKNHRPRCECPQGYSGDPNRGCQADLCSHDRDCPDSRICKRTRTGIKDCLDPCQGKRCGPNAQCVATGHSAFCECRDGFVGNGDDLQKGCRPRDKCKTDSDCSDRDVCRLNVEGVKDCSDACLETLCGRNAICSASSHIAVCNCPSDYLGDPYDRNAGCELRPPDLCTSDAQCPHNAVCRPDVTGLRNCFDACDDVRCGPHAHCISENHVARCECLPNYEGNAYDEVKGCQLPHHCNTDQDCRSEEVCRKHTDAIRKCVYVCFFDQCGPNAECYGENHLAVCRCPPGFEGNPIDSHVGCVPRSPNVCESDRDCGSQQVCQAESDGHLDCKNACEYVTCGPNAVCVSRNHQAKCECLKDHEGDPYNIVNGCKPPVPNECQVDHDCRRSGDVCKSDNSGVRRCIDPCTFNTCGRNTDCISIDHHHECQCKEGFVRDPSSDISCIAREFDECKEDMQCPSFKQCKTNVFGIMKCAEICLDFSCSPNADCIALNHKGQCTCEEGYTGDPTKRDGCYRIPQCHHSDDCAIGYDCRLSDEGIFKCIDVCEGVKCGPNAVCVAVGHASECQCPRGLYVGDPYDPVRGCRQVECLTDEDCPHDKSCAPENYCLNPCVNGCGRGAICIAENHHRTCQCPAGYTGDAYGRGCKEIRFCESHPCHPTATCIDTPGSYTCQCALNYIGDPYKEGCRHPNSCKGDHDCRPDAACLPDVSGEHMCKNPCEKFNCGPNAFCEVIDHRPRCRCPSRFRGNPDPDIGCVRISIFCQGAHECEDNQACVDGQCRLFCSRDNECALGEKCINKICVLPCFAHAGCPAREACVPNGYCQVGCRDNNDCPYNEACIQNRCQNPCDTKGVCGPNAICSVKNHKATCECPPLFEGSPTPILGCKRVYVVCSPTTHCPTGLNCVGERCRAPCRDCVDGELCVNGVCMVICSTDSSCPIGEVCINQYCQVGCRADGDCRLNEVCTSNRCTCKPGFNPSSTGCEDNNECLSNPCHPTAVCVNSPGSYFCQCREGDIGDGYTGCRPQGECPNGDRDCPSSAACGKDEQGIPKCINPCDVHPCGPNAECSVSNHSPQCFCPKTHLFTGDPYDLNRGCVEVDCLKDSDCGFDKQCVNFMCESPCGQVNCGPYGTCVVRNRQALCRCEPGYENNGRLTCIDIDECKQHPCHPTAVCENTPGSFTCRCPTGLTGNPLINPGCHDPNICFNGDSDCADSAACVRVKGEPYCRDPCESPTACGVNADCRTVHHQVVCTCPAGYTGDPHYRCTKVECTVNEECKDSQVCEKNKCIDVCSSQVNCGHNTVCLARNHAANCRCRDGFYGDPIAGCRKIIPCDSDINCPAGELCQKGVCNVPCNRDRDCGSNERCELGRCVSICRADSDCPEHQVCSLSKCVPDNRCSSDNECSDTQACRASDKGYNDCIDPCDLVLCGSHAHCVSHGHVSVCKCDKGYIGDPVDRGCEQVQCLQNDDCPPSQVCENFECIDPCQLKDICGPNAFCESRDHSPICRCHEGYDGDPIVGCRSTDYCANRPCHHTALCKNKFGGYDCYCPPERNIGNPFSDPGCRGENECPLGDSDCPLTAYCDRTTIPPMCKNPCQAPGVCGVNELCRVENHRAACYCLPGFSKTTVASFRGCTRVIIDCSSDHECASGFVCVNKRCKLRCRADEDCATREFCHQGQCVLGCREDSECLSREICAANKCVVGCRTDNDCYSNEACILNICTDPCASPTACGTNTLCRVHQHRQQCSCSPGFSGNPNIACIRILPSCLTEADCPQNQYCLDKKCRVECNTDTDCSAGEKCVNNHCLVMCRRDQDCQDEGICIRNHCQAGCRTNDQCRDHLACVSNQCRDPCEGSATCGPNAECRVSDHRSVCSCREGFVGRPNANVGCIRPQVICLNEPCPSGLTCHNGRCRMPCNTVRDCAVNEKCIDSRCYVQCIRDRDCYAGEICEQNFCRVGCRADSECAFHEACISNQCINPCDSPTACGTNANCDVINHSIHCSCPSGLTGDPYTQCDRLPLRCDADERCGLGRYCENSICRVTCGSDNECLDNEKCVDRRCSVICTNDKSCPTGFICEYGQCISGCRHDVECPLAEACINNNCLNPCASPTACGTKAQCQPVNHRPLCSCLPEHTGDPRVECSRVECIIDSDCGTGKICLNYRCHVGCRSDQGCLNDEVCIMRQCQKLCMFSDTCGVAAFCTADLHRASCSCPPGYTGNPVIECRKIVEGACERTSDCPHGKVCINKRCEDDVECRKDEDCLLGHICQRNKCFVGCRSDENCRLDEGCYNSQCQRVCSLPRACGQNARCEALSHTARCSCLPGFSGNPQIECRPIGPECRRDSDCHAGQQCIGQKCTVVPGCTSDNDCSQGQICENTKCIFGCRSHSDCGFTQECYENQCQNPCRQGRCGVNAECRAISHSAVCRCPPDYSGDPKILCSLNKVECHVDTDCELGKICVSNRCLEGCRYNEHCPDDKACIQGRCDTPCRPGSCGFNALCRATDHQAVCTCPQDYVGNARIQCSRDDVLECKHNADCSHNEVCENNICVVITGCRSDSFCNVGEICENRKCIGGCRRDSDCTFDKACVSSRCVNPCTVQYPCGSNTDCRPIMHRPHCTCKSGFEGNPSDYCKEIPLPSIRECLTDSDCPTGKICESTHCRDGCRRNENCPFNKVCNNRQCEDPCSYPDTCGHGAECLVHNHHVICTCPTSLTGDPNVQCVPVPHGHCYTDNECAAGHICENKRCIEACRNYHSCPYDKDCVNRRCQDPCSFFGACGTGANCHVNNHKVVCTCPPGYSGDARRSCVKDVQPDERCISDSECGNGFFCDSGECFEGCRHDYQCGPEYACVQRKCEPVCSQPGVCGINAHCMADNHRPICTCNPGYVGDARVECVLVPEPECKSDSDCPIRHICSYEKCIIGCRNDENCGTEEACINRICQNPCSVFGACGRNAICKPINHKPECSCPSGFEGNPNVLCRSAEVKPECTVDHECNVGYICENTRCVAGCRHDNNCPRHLACVQRQCQDPCLLPNSCGKNAECHVDNHRPVCTCPSNFRGDAYIECRLAPPDVECHHDLECSVDKICENTKCIKGCRNDANCRFEETCINRFCQNPCSVQGACGDNAICKAINHDRVCTCAPGFTGNAHTLCSRVRYHECTADRNCSTGQICQNYKCVAGCRTDSNCPYDETCLHSQCQTVCHLSGACGQNAHCTPVNHRPYCSCPAGYTGNANVSCTPIVEPGCRRDSDCAVSQICVKYECISGCRSHSNCPYDKACVNRICQDPCTIGGICGVNTQCHASDHKAVCQCIPTYTGDPLRQCTLIEHECETDSHCGRNFVCVNNKCKDINECLRGRGPCALGAVCTNLPGGYKCGCPVGLDGDPYRQGCRASDLCRRDEDCKSNEACDRLTGECYEVCSRPGICGRGAQCTAANHHHECYCPPGLTGNPYIECSILEFCGAHKPCSGNLQCFGTHCGCPASFEQVGFFCILTSRNCSTSNPCPENEECVSPDNPSGICVCPKGFVLMSNGICRDVNECDQGPFPCGTGAQCFNTLGSYRCQCPPGTVGEPFYSGCQRREGYCQSDVDCPHHLACDIAAEQCYDPCVVSNPCGRNAECSVEDHSPQCACLAGFIGNPVEYCYPIGPGCQTDNECPGNLLCLPDGHCGCPGEFQRLSDFCILTSINCTTTNPCPENQRCVYTGRVNGFCFCPRGYRLLVSGLCIDVDECVEGGVSLCGQGARCVNTPGSYECQCPQGYEGEPYRGVCEPREEPGCKSDRDCLFHEACDVRIGECYDVCTRGHPCGQNAVCRGENHQPSCTCPPRYRGNPKVNCFFVPVCGVDYNCPGNLICLNNKECGCPPHYERVGDYCLITSRNCTTTNPCPTNEECLYTGVQQGFCVCPRGYELMDNGLCRDIDECKNEPCAPNARCTNLQGSYRCYCPPEYIGDPIIRGCTYIPEGCKFNTDCPSDKECDLNTGQCISPCYQCGVRAVCTARNHEAICSCPTSFVGDAYDHNRGCYEEPGVGHYSTPGPRPELSVVCLADGVQVSIVLDGFNGVIYVKGHSQDPVCRRIVSSTERDIIDFKVLFNNCGLIHVNGEASFILVIQKHPRLMTYRARAYHIKCVYNTGEKTITLGFNVSMITTSGTIANTGPPPTCEMKISNADGSEVTSAEIGDDLLLMVNVQPDFIYGGFARSCVAKTMEDNEEIQYEVTDSSGCATEPSIFGNWQLDPDRKLLVARFNAFKFPTSNNLRFQCNIRVCFGSCPPVNCNGVDAFGKRKKRQAEGSRSLSVEGFQEGALREEIMVQSNAILTFEKKENQVAQTTEGPTVEEIDNVCLPKLGLIISLVITTLLALVAVAVAISCWLMAYRRRPKAAGPLPHPPDFPNPLYTTPEPVAEPSPDYYPSSHNSL